VSRTPEKTRILQCATVDATLRGFLLPFGDHFRGLGYDVDAAASGTDSSPVCHAAFSQVFDLPWSRNPARFCNISSMRALRSIVEERQYSIVHVHTPVAAFISRIALRKMQRSGRVKIIYTAHGFHFRRGGAPIQNLVYVFLEKLAGQWTDYLVVINQEDRAAAARLGLVPTDRVRYMPGIGVDTRFYSPTAVLAEDVMDRRREFDIAEGPLLLMIADFNPGKRHRDAIRAFARVDNKESHLALAGEGPELAGMRELAQEEGIARRIHFLGFREDIRELIKSSLVTILPSEREGLPRSVMESLCMQVPVIGTDIRGIRDLLSSAQGPGLDSPGAETFKLGDCGVLFPVGDIDALTAAMNWTMSHPEEVRNMGQAGRANMATYDIKRILELHEQLYSEALKSEIATNGGTADAPQKYREENHASPRSGWYRRWGKRTVDVAISALLLVLFMPLTFLIAVAIRLTMGAPILFRQPRPGRNERIFTMLKFRTMSDDRNPSGELNADAVRVTRLGKFLRATSLDEVPELWNVLRGDMSLVGPRPLLEEYLPLYSKRQQRRHTVRPGITGLAQVRGRNLTTWHRRFGLDTHYVDHISPRLDLHVATATIRAVFCGDGGIEAVEKLDFLAEEAAKRGSF
jgi:lipopolysaccharide/colanic/teichoic acid biosynthesis glycosyltransferase/glycosyltransferase involved in cell wall biosynthesis